jgi:branched-chain amino acid transport system permease protein
VATVRERLSALEARLPGERSATRDRAIRMAIGAVIALIVLAAFGALNGAAVIVLLVIAAIYVPGWETLPRVGRYVRTAAVIAIAITYPFYWNNLFTIPVFGEFPSVPTGVVMLVFIMMAVGLNIVVGYAGLLDLGYVAFYAMGAYIAAWFSSVQFAGVHVHFLAVGVGSGTPGFHISVWILLVAAGIVTAIVGVLIGLPTLRLRGDYLAIVTLGFGEIVRLVLVNWQDLTNGPNGIGGIPRPTFLGLPFVNKTDVPTFAGTFGLKFSPEHRLIFLYFVILALSLVVYVVTERLRKMPVGRAWEALREDETACRALGINPTNTKLSAFAVGAMFGGFAGAFFAARQGFISPESFTFMESATVLAIVVLGGMGSQIGIVLAAMALVILPEIGREFAEFRMLAFGAAMVAVMVWRPQGLVAHRDPTITLRPAGGSAS